jgi:hypothetical protein
MESRAPGKRARWINRITPFPPSILPPLPPSSFLLFLLTFAATVAMGHGVSVLLAVAVIVRLGFSRVPDAGNEDALLERTISCNG